MFGWLFSAKCPVAPDRKAWIEQRLNWLGGQFGARRMLARSVILPTPEFFPDPFDGSRQAANLIFDRVCRYMEVSRDRVALVWYANDRDRIPHHLREGRSEGAAGLYTSDHLGRVAIGIDEAELANPASLIGTMAHELGHVHLLADGRISGDTPDHEHLTDLLTVLYGLGVFTANSVIHESNWNDGQVSGWSVGRKGYLTGPEYGYAFAVLARAQGDSVPGWASHLRLDVRSALKQGLRYLRKTNESPFRLDGPAATVSPTDDDLWTRPKPAPDEPAAVTPEDDVPWTRPKPAPDEDEDEDDNLPPWKK